MMTLKKGDIIKQVKSNPDKLFENTTANGTLTYRVDRVNPKTYTLTCIEGYMKNSGCYLHKGFKEKNVDVYGTTTEYFKIS